MKLFDPYHWLLGNLRYQLFYSPRFNWLIRKHISQQIVWRIEMMNPTCFNTGSCVECGCKTTALQMANKACDGKCYPPMMSRRKLKRFLEGEEINGWLLLIDRQKVYTYSIYEDRENYMMKESHYLYHYGTIVNEKDFKKQLNNG